MSEPTGQRRIVTALIVVASLIGFFAVFALWAKRQLLETDNWVETSSELLQHEDVRDATAGFLVDELYANVDVQAELSSALPPRAQPLAGPLAGAVRQLADRAAAEALSRPRVQAAWAEANRAAQEAFVKVVEGDGNDVSTQNGEVTLNLNALVSEVGGQAGTKVAGKLPPEAGQIVILKSDQLSALEDIVNLLRKLAYVLPILALALYALAVYLARGRRREALRSVGFGFIAIGIAVLVARSLAGSFVVNSLTATASSKDAADTTWQVITSMLRDGGLAMLGYGIAIVLAAWLAGPGGLATGARRSLAPLLHDRGLAYLSLAVIVAVIFWLSPTEGTSRLLPSLLLIGLLIAGTEVLRNQTLREFPNETLESASERWRSRFNR